MEWWPLLMQLKTYRARSMSDALARVKADLGRDAVILHTRTLKRGGVLGVGARSQVEITATADAHLVEGGAQRSSRTAPQTPASAQPGAPAGVRPEYPPTAAEAPASRLDRRAGPTSDAVLRRDVEAIRDMVDELLRDRRRAEQPQLPAELIDYYTELVGQAVAVELASRIVGHVWRRLDDSGKPGPARRLTGAAATARDRRIRQELAQCLSEMIPPASPLKLKTDAGPTIVAMVGPTGVGKTTTIAKLAANMKLREHKRVGLVTIDTYRIAAVEQLKTYAQILDVPLLSVVTPEEMKTAIARLSDRDLILIDTAGRSQKDEARLAELKHFLAAAEPNQVHLVLSTTSREDAIRDTIQHFAAVGADHLIFTKLDEAIGLGVILNVVESVGMRLSYLTNGQSVPDDIEVGTAHRVARLILQPEERAIHKGFDRPTLDVTVGEGA